MYSPYFGCLGDRRLERGEISMDTRKGKEAGFYFCSIWRGPSVLKRLVLRREAWKGCCFRLYEIGLLCFVSVCRE